MNYFLNQILHIEFCLITRW